MPLHPYPHTKEISMTTVTTKLKLLTLTQRVSAKGTPYLQGILGGLSVVGFQGKDNEWGPTWDLFISERPQKPQGGAQGHGQQRPSRIDQDAVDLFQRPLSRDGRG
jgi:hypothetical protein